MLKPQGKKIRQPYKSCSQTDVQLVCVVKYTQWTETAWTIMDQIVCLLMSNFPDFPKFICQVSKCMLLNVSKKKKNSVATPRKGKLPSTLLLQNCRRFLLKAFIHFPRAGSIENIGLQHVRQPEKMSTYFSSQHHHRKSRSGYQKSI